MSQRNTKHQNNKYTNNIPIMDLSKQLLSKCVGIPGWNSYNIICGCFWIAHKIICGIPPQNTDINLYQIVESELTISKYLKFSLHEI